MGYKKKIQNLRSNSYGDTIVEVLLAIAIASLTIGIAYGTAQRSLRQSITAREHNEALNIIENQLADLKLRFHNTPEANFTQFAYPNSHYCLEDTASDPNASNWAPINNDSTVSESSPLQSNIPPNASNPYHSSCVKQGTYYVDIVTNNSTATENPTLYRIIVRWESSIYKQNNQASIYYKLNGGTGLNL